MGLRASNWGVPNATELDLEYRDAVERGDMPAAQALVGQAAQASGFSLGPLWRAERSGRGRMTDAIEGGIYFFPDRARAELWAGEVGNVQSAYIKPGVTKDVHESEGSLTRGIAGLNPATGLEGANADTIIRRYPGSDGIAEIVVFSGDQIRAADPVMRGESNEVLLLSMRFALPTPMPADPGFCPSSEQGPVGQFTLR